MNEHDDEDEEQPEVKETPAVDPIAQKKAEDARIEKEKTYLRRHLDMTDDEIKTLFPTPEELHTMYLDTRKLQKTADVKEKAGKEVLLPEDKLRVQELDRKEAVRAKKKTAKVSKQVTAAAAQGAEMLKPEDRPSTADYEATMKLFAEVDMDEED